MFNLKLVRIFLWCFIFITSIFALESKTVAHLISLPLIEGSGVYFSIRLLNSNDNNLEAAGITNLSLLGINGSLGAYTLWSGNKNYTLLRKIHRITGFVVSGVSMWAAISAARSNNVNKIDKLVGGGYAIFTAVPIIVFSF